jgi:hypothetical protein
MYIEVFGTASLRIWPLLKAITIALKGVCKIAYLKGHFHEKVCEIISLNNRFGTNYKVCQHCLNF